MSHKATTRAWEVGARGNDLLVLLALADVAGGHDDPYDYAYPAVPTVATMTGLSPRTVQRCLRSLEDAGTIRRTGEHVWRAGKVTTQYRIEGATDRQGRQTDTPDNRDAMGRHSDTQPRPTETPSVSGESSARASSPEDFVPDDFPADLRPHARRVMAVLRDVAERRGARRVTARAVALTVAARPRKPLVTAAHDCAAWIEDHPEVACRDVVARYRRWLDREPDLQGLERLDAAGVPTSAPIGRPANVRPIRPGGRGSPEDLADAERLRAMRLRAAEVRT